MHDFIYPEAASFFVDIQVLFPASVLTCFMYYVVLIFRTYLPSQAYRTSSKHGAVTWLHVPCTYAHCTEFYIYYDGESYITLHALRKIEQVREKSWRIPPNLVNLVANLQIRFIFSVA